MTTSQWLKSKVGSSSPVWGWAERISHAFTVIGLPIAIIGLAIAIWQLMLVQNEVSRKQEFTIKLEGPTLKDGVLPLERESESSNLSKPARVNFNLRNIGNKSAKDVVVLADVPKQISISYISNTMAVSGLEGLKCDPNPNVKNPEVKSCHVNLPFIHPQLGFEQEIDAVFPFMDETYQIRVFVLCDECQYHQDTLNVQTKTNP